MKNIGLIGYGGMGGWHCELVAGMPEDINIAAVYDINPEKVKKASLAGHMTYDALEEILADDNIDTIIIAVPNNFHMELSIKALRAKKHVICEKPAMMNTNELLKVIAVSEKEGKLFSVHQNRRWDKDYRIIKQIMRDNLIGKPYIFESRVQGAKGIPGDWRCVKEAGGGMLYDWGVHLIDQLLWEIESPVTEVYTHMQSIKHKEVDDNFKLLMRFENGVLALVEVSTNTFIPLPRWHVSGENGTVLISDFSCEGKIVRAKTSEVHWDEGIVYTAAGPTRTMAPRAEHTLETIPLPDIKTDACDYYRNFHKATIGQEELCVKPSQAVRVMRVIDAAFESAETNKCVQTKI